MQHPSKISQLPCGIREQLNRRLDKDQSGKDILAWLNGLPEVHRLGHQTVEAPSRY